MSIKWRKCLVLFFAVISVLLFSSPVFAGPADECTEQNTWKPDFQKGQPVEIKNKTVCIGPGEYHYGFVNIHSKGKLIFKDAAIDFWAKSILVEKDGSLIAGSEDNPISSKITIHLYGKDEGPGITCKTTSGPPATADTICGVPRKIWTDGGMPEGMTANFYRYKNLPTYDDEQDGDYYFGRKVLAVSYGGTLQLFGKKGAAYAATPGVSWTRLNHPANATDVTLALDKAVDWQKNDQIVLTTTDFLPGHSEKQSIEYVDDSRRLIEISDRKGVKYFHNGIKYPVEKTLPDRMKGAPGIQIKDVETRAAVALLSRNIVIKSEGDNDNEQFYDAEKETQNKRYFGGHTIVRQGFAKYQVQGVEFYHLGQGGRMAHAPVNFLLTQNVPAETFVRDCSIHDSMSHWIELRGTQNVFLERNIGYLSIGHGFVLADGTEINNILRGNIGIYSRPAVEYPDNPRRVPGVTANVKNTASNLLQNAGDVIHPSVFFIMNGYNTFEDNMAAGAGACGSCYWFPPAKMSGLSKENPYSFSWEGYAAIGRNEIGKAPIFSFKGNFCTTAQNSFVTVGAVGSCNGVYSDMAPTDPSLKPIPNPYTDQYVNRSFFPQVSNADWLVPTICAPGDKNDPDSCGTVNSEQYKFMCAKGQTQNCSISVLDSYTSSFNWAQQNFSAIWLRGNWFLVTNSALTDILNGGLTMVSGGTYDQVVNGYWALTRRSVFVGSTQNNNPFATNAGPVNAESNLSCEDVKGGNAAHCLLRNEGISFPMDNFSVYQRFYNIYDGPVYQETNAYLNIRTRRLVCEEGGTCNSSPFMYGPKSRGIGIPKARENSGGVEYSKGVDAAASIKKGDCFMPNAAIGWKQPNGFYYPPAFHSNNLFFDNVDLRHFIIVPLFDPGKGKANPNKVKSEYCTYPSGDPGTLFSSDFSDIDRQTELNDNDGTLSGLAAADPIQIPRNGGTISVNRDKFFDMPVNTVECLSQQSCLQAPNDYITAVIFANCARRDLVTGQAGSCNEWKWNKECENRKCYGVPIYRQLLKDDETAGPEQSIRMMGGGISQRSTLLSNKGVYYIDTTVSRDTQANEIKDIPGLNADSLRSTLFDGNHTYDFFLLYAKPATRATFQLYVGKNFNPQTGLRFIRVGQNHHDKDLRADDAYVLSSPVQINVSGADSKPLTWPWSPAGFDSTTGILTVTMDLSVFADDFKKGVRESCGPPSFCQWQPDANPANADGGSCVAKVYPAGKKPIGYQLDDAACQWSLKAAECPSGGCPGFQVDFPAGFTADGQNPRPTPVKFAECNKIDPQCNADIWKIKWVYPADGLSRDAKQANSCVYDKDNPPALPDKSIW